MSTLEDIQKLVNQAKEASPDDVNTYFIPKIKIALAECTVIEWKYRMDMVNRISELLDEQGLEGISVVIDLEEQLVRLQTGGLQVPSSKPGPWRPHSVSQKDS